MFMYLSHSIKTIYVLECHSSAKQNNVPLMLCSIVQTELIAVIMSVYVSENVNMCFSLTHLCFYHTPLKLFLYFSVSATQVPNDTFLYCVQ